MERVQALGKFIQPHGAGLRQCLQGGKIRPAHQHGGDKARQRAHRHALHKERHADEGVSGAHEFHNVNLLAAGEHRQADGI